MKKKSLLLAIAAMSMAAVGVGTVGTFAWYQATQKLTASGVGSTLSAATAITNADDKTIYAKFELEQGSTAKMVSKDGYEYYLNAANRLYKVSSQPSLAAGEQYGTATFKAVTYWNDAECTASQITASEELALIQAGSLTVTVTAGTRSRVAKNAPTAVGTYFYAADGTGDNHGFGASLGNAVQFSVSIAVGGDVTGLATVYYAVNGSGTSLIDSSTLDSTYVGTVISESSWLDGTTTITQNLVVTVA